MACGLPVVTARNSSLPEVGGDAVLYADPRQPESIAAGLDRVLTDHECAADLGRRAAARARTFTNAEAGRRCVDILTQVASAGRRSQLASEGAAALPSPDLSADEARLLSDRLTRAGERPGKVVIYGAGKLGLDLARALDSRGHAVVGLTDADPSKWGLTLDRWPVLSIAEMFRHNPSAVVLGSRASAADMKARLLELGFARNRVWALDGESPSGP